MNVLHTAIEISDLTVMRDFYENLLGLHQTREYETGGVHNYYVAGANQVEIQFRVVDEPRGTAGLNHIAIETNNVDTAVAQARNKFNSTVTMEPRTLDRVNQRIAFITDPEGYTIQLVENQ